MSETEGIKVEIAETRMLKIRCSMVLWTELRMVNVFMKEKVSINLRIVWHFSPVVKTRNMIVIAAVRG